MKQTNDLLAVRRLQLNPPSIGGTPALAGRLAQRNCRPLGADPRGFLADYFGRKSGAGDLPGYSGSLVFRTPGGAHQAITHTWLVQPTLAFTINQLFQHFEFWLQQRATTQLFAANVRPSLLRGAPSATELLSLRTMAAHEARVALQSHERRLQSFSRDPSIKQLPAAPGEAGERGLYAVRPIFRWVTLAGGGRRDAAQLAHPGRTAFDRPTDSSTGRSTQVLMGDQPGPFLAGIRELWQPTPLLDRQWSVRSILMTKVADTGHVPLVSPILRWDRPGYPVSTVIAGVPPNFRWVTLAARRTAAGAQPVERSEPVQAVQPQLMAVVAARVVDARLAAGFTPQQRPLVAPLPIIARFVQQLSVIHEQRRPSLEANRPWAVGTGADALTLKRAGPRQTVQAHLPTGVAAKVEDTLLATGLTPQHRAWVAHLPILAQFVQQVSAIREQRRPPLEPNRSWAVGGTGSDSATSFRGLQPVFLTPVWRWFARQPAADLAEARIRFLPAGAELAMLSNAQLMSRLRHHLVRDVSAAQRQSAGEAALRSFDPTLLGWLTPVRPMVAPLRRGQPTTGATPMRTLGQTPAMNPPLPLLVGYRFSHEALGMAGPDPIHVRRAAFLSGADVGQREQGRSELTLLRRGERFEAPTLRYVFVQAAQPTVEEQQVIKTVREKEVVEIVKKEVQTIMSTGAALKLLQADYTQIADRVHFSLARQLLTEKERRGL